MFKLNLKIALRNLWKYKGYSLINVLGLAIGLAGSLLIFIFCLHQLSFDKGYENPDRIYRVVSSWKYPEGLFHNQGVPRPMAAAMREDFPQLERVATVRRDGGILKVEKSNDRPEIRNIEMVYYVEQSFLDIFQVPFLNGRADLATPFTASISEKAAVEYFGSSSNAVGKTFRLVDGALFKVTGVYQDFGQDSSFDFQIMLSYPSYKDYAKQDWGSVSSSQECYVLLKPGADPEAINKGFTTFVKKHYEENAIGKEGHSLQPLADIHHNEAYGNYSGKIMPKAQLVGLGVIGLFLLITACINFINLATAQAISRSKEVGVRKVMGSRKTQLIRQFLSETSLITLIALLLASVLTELSLPLLNELMGGETQYTLFDHPEVYGFMLVLVVFVSFLAGLYPALIMSGFSPALAIKNKVSASGIGGVGLRKALVVLQFTISGVLIIATMVVINQMTFMREKPLGFDKGNIALIDVPRDSVSQVKLATLRERLLQQPGVEDVSFNMAAPASQNTNEANFQVDGKDSDFQMNVKSVDENYFKTFGLKLVAGRNLAKSDTIREFVVNETLLKRLNITRPEDGLGKVIRIDEHKGPIVGVVKDFYNNSLHSEISPIGFFTMKKQYGIMAVRTAPGKMAEAIKMIEAETLKTFTDFVFSNNYFDEEINQYYQTEQLMSTLFKVFAGVIIFISFIGLFGLISFIATQRTKEIAIRRILGASTFDLVKMLNGSFLVMVFIANLVAWPLAYMFASNWLKGFAYRIDIEPWPFIAAMFLSLFITLITVSLRSYRAANGNTIDALKYE